MSTSPVRGQITMSFSRAVAATSMAWLVPAMAAAQPAPRPVTCAPAQTAAVSDSVQRFRTALTAFIHESLDSLPAVPGVGVAVVGRGAAMYSCGIGLADVEAHRPLTPQSSVYIASNTKPFFGLLSAIMEQRGSIELDAPITRYFGAAAFPPAVRADSVTVRHLLTHTAGLSNDPIVFRTAYTGDHDPDALRRLLPGTSVRDGAPRGTFGYTNLGYVLTSMILDDVAGRSWQELLRAEVLQPLGMNATSARASVIDTAAHPLATGYIASGRASRERVELEKADATMHAAGGMMSTMSDLELWLRALLGYSSDSMPRSLRDALRSSTRVHAEAEGSTGPFSRVGYGLGWLVGAYGDHPLVYHFGSFPGTHSMISFMPAQDLGVAVFANEDVVGVRLTAVISMFVYDWWTGAADPGARARGLRAQLVNMLAEQTGSASRTRPALSAVEAARLVGTYRSEHYGTLIIRADESGAVISIGRMRGRALATDTPGSFDVELIPGRPERFHYDGTTGQVSSVRYEDYTEFVRIPPPPRGQ